MSNSATNKAKLADDMALNERVARVETMLGNVAHQADMVRLEERIVGLSSVITKFIELKDFHNDVLEKRMTEAEKKLSSIAVEIAPIPGLVAKQRIIETVISGINVKMALIGFIAGAAFAAGLSQLIGLIK